MSGLTFIIHDVDQRSEEWRALRLGRLTASRAADMTAKHKDGKTPSTSRANLKTQLVLERLTGRSHEGSFASRPMDKGIEREADAIVACEAHENVLVRTCGFLTHPTLMVGASLDGYMGEFETLLSIKCRQPTAHLDFLKSGRIPTDALMQMVHELWLTGAQEHLYFSWNPDFPPALQAKSKTVKREDCGIPAYEDAALKFLAEVDAEVQALRTAFDLPAVLQEAVAS